MIIFQHCRQVCLQCTLALLVLVLLPFGLSGQGSSTSPFWEEAQVSEFTSNPSARQIVPTKFRSLKLNQTALRDFLKSLPTEAKNGTPQQGKELQFPLPSGGFARYKVWEISIMAPALAATFPELKTYAGYNLDKPSESIRFDFTPQGFHAMTYGAGNSMFIDPYAKGNTSEYMSYFKKDFVKKTTDRITCSIDNALISSKLEPSGTEFVGDCGIRHEYRLAVSATGEYTTFHGGTVSLAMAAITTTMNRVNGVFEKDISTRMILISNNNLIVHTNAATDPFTNGDPNAMINQNQSNTDLVIGQWQL